MAASDDNYTTAIPTTAQLAALAKVKIKNELGEDVLLSTLLKGRVILLWVRHFQCGYCSDFVSYLGTRITQEALAKAGVRLIVIGCGAASFIRPYRALLETPFEVFADPTKQSYVTLGMTKRTLDAGVFDKLPEYITGSAFANIISSIISAFKMGNLLSSAGDIKQLGGEFVIEDGTKVLYAHRMLNTRDHASISSILQAAEVEDEMALN